MFYFQDTWKQSLRNTFKHLRRKVQSPETLKAKEKFGPKKKTCISTAPSTSTTPSTSEVGQSIAGDDVISPEFMEATASNALTNGTQPVDSQHDTNGANPAGAGGTPPAVDSQQDEALIVRSEPIVSNFFLYLRWTVTLHLEAKSAIIFQSTQLKKIL